MSLDVWVSEPRVQSAEIANGASTSSTILLDSAHSLVALQMPAAWSAASLTFDGSFDGTTFVPIHYGAGAYTITSAQGAAASLGVSLAPEAFIGWPYVRIRSGVIGTYVNQGAARTIKVLTRAV